MLSQDFKLNRILPSQKSYDFWIICQNRLSDFEEEQQAKAEAFLLTKMRKRNA